MPDTISVGYSVLTSARTVSVKASKYSRSGASGWDVFPGIPKNMWIGSEKRHTRLVNGWPMFIVPLWWSWHGLPLWCCEGTLKSWCCKELWASRHLPKLSEPDVSKVLVNREEKRTQRNQLNRGVKRLPSQVLREKLPGLTATRCHPRQQQRCYVCVDTPLIHLKVVSIHFNQLWLINTYISYESYDTWHIRSYLYHMTIWLLCSCKHPSPPEPSSAAAVVSPWRHDLISFPILPRCTSCASLFFPFFWSSWAVHGRFFGRATFCLSQVACVI